MCCKQQQHAKSSFNNTYTMKKRTIDVLISAVLVAVATTGMWLPNEAAHNTGGIVSYMLALMVAFFLLEMSFNFFDEAIRSAGNQSENVKSQISAFLAVLSVLCAPLAHLIVWYENVLLRGSIEAREAFISGNMVLAWSGVLTIVYFILVYIRIKRM